MNPITTLDLMNSTTCTYSGCKTKFDGLIRLSGKYGKDLSWTPNGEYLFHYQDTHGFPHEMLIEELTKIVTAPITKDDIDLYNDGMKTSCI